ncbi:MAG: hypothetical protein WC123_02925 [Bacilli bacterium]
MISKFLKSIFLGLSLLFTSINPISIKSLDTNVANEVNIYFFHVENCSSCAKIENLLDDIKKEYENVNIIKYMINDDNPESAELLNKIAEAFDEDQVATPFVTLGGKHYVGYNVYVSAQITKYVEKYTNNDFIDVTSKIINNQPISNSDFDLSSDDEFYLPIIGNINIKNTSLILISVVLGLVDGFNPCAMWVLIFLITLLLPTKDKKRIWIIGGIFLLTSAIFYFIIMMAWIETISLISAKTIFQIIIGAFAMGAGIYNLYNFFKNLKNKDVGCEVTNENQRMKLMQRIQRLTSQKSLLIAVGGVIVLAIIVNFIELACSTGLPVLFSQILLINNISGIQAIGYVLVYILFFLIDDLFVFITVITTLKLKGISNKIGKYSSLIGGIIMLLIGILMIFFPNIIMLNF